jgi:hypothetical protein
MWKLICSKNLTREYLTMHDFELYPKYDDFKEILSKFDISDGKIKKVYRGGATNKSGRIVRMIYVGKSGKAKARAFKAQRKVAQSELALLRDSQKDV